MTHAPSDRPASPTPGWTVPALVLASLGAIVGGLLAAPHGTDAWRLLHWTCKPLATGLVLALAWRADPPLSARYRRCVLTALALALLGDVLLMLPGDRFVPGLAAFLLAHLAFLAAWLDDSRFAVRPLALLGCLLAAAGLMTLLWSFLVPPLRVPVGVYALVLATMAGQALGRARQHASTGDARALPARRAALGALLFMASDSLLAWDRFRHPLPLATLWVLGTYYPAIALIAWSAWRVPERAR